MQETDQINWEEILTRLTRIKALADRAVTLAGPGDVMSPPPKGTMSGRVAFVTVLAATAQACEAALDAAHAALIVQPATPAVSPG